MATSTNQVESKMQQLNTRLPWALVIGAKRLAQKRGIPLSEFLANLIAEALSADASAIQQQIAEEREAMQREHDALLAELERMAQKQAAAATSALSPGNNDSGRQRV